jgi:hypothetical protein
MRWRIISVAASAAVLALLAPIAARAQVQESKFFTGMAKFNEISSENDIRIGEMSDRLFASCDLSQAALTDLRFYNQASDEMKQETVNMKITRWSGGCKDGKRDGAGKYRLRMEAAIGGEAGTSESEVQGTAVNGKQVGLWCEQSGSRDLKQTCSLFGPDATYGSYSETGDGHWYPANWTGDRVGEIPAAALQAESERLIAVARAGENAGATAFTIKLPALANLTQGEAIRIAPRPHHSKIDLRGKRVALVYSDATLAAMKQFRSDAQTALTAAATSTDFYPKFRADFAGWATPERFMQSIGAPLLRAGATIVPANDLGALARGEADYAFLVDWHYTWRSSMTQAEYEALPVCKDSSDPRCTRIYDESLWFYLIGPGPALLWSDHSNWSDQKLSDAWAHDELMVDLDSFVGRLFDPSFGTASGTINMLGSDVAR